MLSPLDIIPECFFGVIGILDDLIAMSLIFLILSNIYYQHLSRRDSNNFIQMTNLNQRSNHNANNFNNTNINTNNTVIIEENNVAPEIASDQI